MEQSSSSPRQALEVGQIIPAFSLNGPDGVAHSPWNYKQRAHIVLLGLHSSAEQRTRNILSKFGAQYSAFRQERCVVLAITPDPVITNLTTQQALNLPYPLLSDVTCRVLQKYTVWDHETKTGRPTIVLADLYGALRQQWIDEHESALPEVDEILATLKYLNIQCRI